MQREVIKWLQSVDLSAPIQNPKRDLATGHLAAEIVAHYTGTKYLDVHRLPTGAAAATKRDVWSQVYAALQQLHCAAVTQPLVDAVLRREPNAALTVLECLYEHFTGHALPMRGLDAVGTVGNAYVQPRNATSTARLLAVTTTATAGKGASLGHGAGKGAVAAAAASLFDPLASPSGASATGGAAVGAGAASPSPGGEGAFGADDGEAAADGMDVTGGTATSSLQQRLALIDNSELAGGANALQTYPRYARPTASTLVHTATGSRKDVVLDRAKYAVDEVQQRQHNSRIVHQHAVVQRLQEAVGDAGARQGASAAPEEDTRVPTAAPTGSLMALYRGRFYRQAETAPTGAKAGAHAGAARRTRKSRREDGAMSPNGGLLAQDLITIADDATDRNTLVGAGDLAAPSEHGGVSAGGAGGGTSGSSGGPRVIPKLRVNVHPPSLQAALARRSGQAELQERAAALSREHFAKHNYSLRPALSDILADVLAAHKQLQRLFDCCVDDGGGEVLDNVLGHLLSHRDEFPLTCTQACWQALVQHVDGVAAALQRNPDEYGYLMESFAFAFGRDAAQVPLLHVSQAVTVDGEQHEDDLEELRAYSESSRRPGSAASRRSFAVSARGGSVAGPGHAAASAAAAVAARRQSQFSGVDGYESAAGSPRHRQSLGEALLTATHRAASIVPGSLTSPNGVSLSSTPRQRAIVDTRDGLPLAFAFGFLYRIARKLDARTAAYVLERYLLRCAKPFLLRRGTVAVREAIARVVSASYVAPSAVASKTGDDADAAAAAAAAVTQAETALVEFLNGKLARTLLGAPRQLDAATAEESSANTTAAGGVSGLALDATTRGGGSGGAAPPLQLRLLRTYWLMFLHVVADYPVAGADAAGAVAPNPSSTRSGGPLAACVLAAARECLASADVDLRTVGVGLTLEYGELWLPRDEDAAAAGGPDGASMTAEAKKLLSCVFPALASAASEGEDGGTTAPWWASPSPRTWEARLMVLRLCNTLLAHPVLEAVPDGRHVIDAAAAACLRTFAEAAPWQRQLALAVAAKSVDATATPALTEAWRRVLLRIPPAALPVQLMPYDEAPVHLRLMRPLQAVSGAKGGEAGRGQSGASTRPQATDRAAAVPPESWTLASASENSAGSASPSATDAPLHLVWGRVLSVYAVAPLNQTWNVRGVVDAVLPSSQPILLSPSSSLSQAHGTASAAAVSPTLQLLVMASALLSPRTTSAAPLAVTASLFRLSTMPATDEGDGGAGSGAQDEAASSRAFWIAALRRAWPLFQACGVKHAGRATMSASSSTIVAAAASHSATAVAAPPAPPAGVSLEDITSIVLSLFLRFADDAAVASAVAAAAGNGSELSASAVRWAEATCGGGGAAARGAAM